MNEQNIFLPKAITINSYGINFKIDDYEKNIISLDKVDFFPNYFNLKNSGNKGSNIILKLFDSQNWDEDEGFTKNPDIIMKICKTPMQNFELSRSIRFRDEVIALNDCNSIDPLSTIIVYHSGVVNIWNPKGKGAYIKHRFYTMECASEDLSSFLINNNLSILDRINLFLEICDSLKLLWDAGYFHRDIKPDNILFFNGKWKLGDLGLVEHRDHSLQVDGEGEWIGPRGWQSPEALNKFVTEQTPWHYRFDSKIDHQSDLYQLGKLLWFITQGNCPEGGIDRDNFYFKEDRLYQVIKPLLNSNKKRRTKDINELIKQMKIVYNIYYKANPIYSLH